MTERLTPLRDRHVTVFGFGQREGVSLVRFLLAESADVLVSDRQEAEQLQDSLAAIVGLPVELNLGGHDAERILGWSDLICVSPVIPRELPLLREAAARGIGLSSEVELFFERCPATILGITGSAGKTTTTTLIGEMLTAAGRDALVGGNIGRPLLGELARIQASTVVVLELSSFQLQPLQRSPQGAVVTNITPNHLDRHSSMEEYIAAKRQIVAHQRPTDWAVLNAADPLTRAFAQATPGAACWFTLGEAALAGDGAYIGAGQLRLRWNGRDEPLLPTAELRLRGPHNQENALAAALAATLAGAPAEPIRQVLSSFGGVEHRLQLVGRYRGANCYDDSIATAPERLLAALRSFEEPLVVIVGGRDKQLPWETAAEALCRRARCVVLTGEARPLLRDALQAAAQRVGRLPRLEEEPGFDAAVAAALRVARPGDAILLSPGCTSYDQFRDFAERGRHFTELVTVAAAQSSNDDSLASTTASAAAGSMH